MSRFDLVAFDLCGTLLNISALAARITPIVGDGAASLLARWRRAQIERSWRLNREGGYEPWDRVTLAALEKVAPELSPDARKRLAALWLTVPAYPDASGALAAIKAAGARRLVLSNGTRAMIARALEANLLSVDKILSAEDLRVYRTDPHFYALLDAEASRPHALIVSGNSWEADGARRAGRVVAWIDRGGEPPATEPDYRLKSLSEVAALLR
jgi:2-haloacid dehalogenase